MATLSDAFLSLPSRFKAEKAEGFKATVHFHLDGDQPAWTVAVADGAVQVQEGHHGDATCTVRSSAAVYLELDAGTTSPEMAFMFGKVKVSNPPQMLKYSKLFRRQGQEA